MVMRRIEKRARRISITLLKYAGVVLDERERPWNKGIAGP